jgi:hypothetical protein
MAGLAGRRLALPLLSMGTTLEELMKANRMSAVLDAILKNSLAGMVGLALAGSVSAVAADIQPAGDDLLRRAAEAAVRANPYLGVFDHVTVDVRDGYVRLAGSVEQRVRRERAAAAIERLPGVLGVRNEIEVQSAAPEDVMLRRRLFERLYYGGAIEGGAQPEWPVRILVNEGRVVLAGDMASSAERGRLEAMAWNAGARTVEMQMPAQLAPVALSAARN